MATDLQARQAPPSAPPSWVGDPLILVYAVRHALTLPGSHQVRFVQQAIHGNARLLSLAGRKVIGRDVKAWLDDDTVSSTPAERAAWIATLAALGVE